MAHVSCAACNARFDVDFKPGTEFTCGQCGAVVLVPVPVIQPLTAAPRPTVAPTPAANPAPAEAPAPAASSAPPSPVKSPAAPGARPGRAAPRAGARRGAVVQKARAASAAPGQDATALRGGVARRGAATSTKKGVHPGLLWGGVGGGVALVVILGVVLSSGGDDPAPRRGGESGAQASQGKGGGSAPSASSATPLELARQAAGDDPSPAAFERWGHLAHESWEQAPDAEKKGLERQWRSAYGELFRTNPDHPLARERMGFVLFDPEANQRILATEGLPKGLTTSLRQSTLFMTEEIFKRDTPTRRWIRLKKGIVEEWHKLSLQAAKEKERYEAFLASPWRQEGMRKAQSEIAYLKSFARRGISFRRDSVQGEPFIAVYREPYVVVSQRMGKGRDQSDAEQDGNDLLDFYTNFYEILGNPAGVKKVSKPLSVIVLANRDDYARYLKRDDPTTLVKSGAHFEPWSNRVVCYRSSLEGLRSALFHEATHQLVDHAMSGLPNARSAKNGQSLWFSEGIAEFFGNHNRKDYDPVTGYSYEFGMIMDAQVDNLKRAIEDNASFDLPDLLGYSRNDFNRDNARPSGGTRTSAAYAQGWALNYLLAQHHGDRYRDAYVDYVKAEMQGRSGPEAFKAAFGADAIERVGTELADFTKLVLKAREDGKIINGRLKTD